MIHYSRKPCTPWQLDPYDTKNQEPQEHKQRNYRTRKREEKGLNFTEAEVAKDVEEGRGGCGLLLLLLLQTRFLPEPNGYLPYRPCCHLHGPCIAKKFNGNCNLRFWWHQPLSRRMWNMLTPSRRTSSGWAISGKHLIRFRLSSNCGTYKSDSSRGQGLCWRGKLPPRKEPYRAWQGESFPQPAVEENLRLFCEMNEGKIEDGNGAAPRLTWPRLTCTPWPYHTASSPPTRTTAPATPGRCTPCTILPTPILDYFEGLPTRSAVRWSLRCTVRRYNWFIDQFADSDYRLWQRWVQTDWTHPTPSRANAKMLHRWRRVWYVAGTTLHAYHLRIAAAATRLRPFTIYIQQDWIHQIWDWLTSSVPIVLSVEDEQRASRVCAVINPTKLIITNYPWRTGGNDDHGEQPWGRDGRNPRCLSARNSTSRRRTSWGSSQEVFPPDSWQRGAPQRAYIVKCTGCKRMSRAMSLRFMPSMTRCRRAARAPWEQPQNKGHHPLGEREACLCLPKLHFYDRLFSVENPSEKGGGFPQAAEPRFAEDCERICGPSLANAKALEHHRSSASATSMWTPTASQASWYSTAPSLWKTAGPRLPRKNNYSTLS